MRLILLGPPGAGKWEVYHKQGLKAMDLRENSLRIPRGRASINIFFIDVSLTINPGRGRIALGRLGPQDVENPILLKRRRCP